MENPVIYIIMGSDSDMEIMKGAGETLSQFGVRFDYIITSAHRSPRRTAEIAQSAIDKGVKVIIVGAGKAAHLAGSVAAWTVLPVIGVPVDASLGGLDALLSTVQMPSGVPVATMSIGKAGAKNAALFAIEILALSDKGIRDKLFDYKRKLASDIEEKNLKLHRQ